jgi:hypothetical protein
MGDVQRDAAQPGAEWRLGPIRVQRAKSPHDGLLRQIVHVGRGIGGL